MKEFADGMTFVAMLSNDLQRSLLQEGLIDGTMGAKHQQFQQSHICGTLGENTWKGGNVFLTEPGEKMGIVMTGQLGLILNPVSCLSTQTGDCSVSHNAHNSHRLRLNSRWNVEEHQT